MRIVFMGTPDFAVPCLEQILADGHEVAAVFCQPDKPKGRGYQLVPPPVKALALEKGLTVHQPATLRDGEALRLLSQYKPDLVVVVAYGKILPPEMLAVPPLGCINIHASLLPKLRGAAPIQWSVLNGHPTTGITVMYMAEGMDTGDILLQKETPIGPQETSGELFHRLSILGAQCLSQIIPMLEAGTVSPIPQDHSAATYAPMLDKSMGNLDFSRSAREIVNWVRGMNPAPCAYTCCGGKRLKIHAAAVAPDFSGPDGCLLDRKRFIVGCGGGKEAVELFTVQPEGKKLMDGCAFVCGRSLPVGELLTDK